MEEIVLHRRGTFDLAAEVDAMETFCRAWAPTYDLVFFTHDHYIQPSDGFRAKVAALQGPASRVDRRAGHRSKSSRPWITC